MTAPPGGYDAALLGNRVFSHYREISLHELFATFRPGDRLLELGAGTGEEALQLARRGIRVLLTDISASQIRLASEKIRREGLDRILEARVMGVDDLARLIDETGAGAFDGAFSSFGALNCAQNIERLPSDLHTLIRPGGRLACSVMNRACGWEMLTGLATLTPGRGLRRLGAAKAAIEGLPGQSFEVRYYTRGDMERLFGRHFRIESVRSHPLLPPPYTDAVFRHLPGFLEWASKREAAVLRGMGDHLFIRMRRL